MDLAVSGSHPSSFFLVFSLVVCLRGVQCLVLTDSNPYKGVQSGTTVELWDCQFAEWSIWTIKPGPNPQVQLTGTDLCLDGGLDYNSGGTGLAYLNTCKEGLAQQQYVRALFLCIQSMNPYI
jgi:hypothetical protein